jgi:hypothetical protein
MGRVETLTQGLTVPSMEGLGRITAVRLRCIVTAPSIQIVLFLVYEPDSEVR